MKRYHLLLAAAVVGAATLPALNSAAAKPVPARASLFSTVMLKKTSDGKILVNSAGSILYEFTKDSKNVDKCAAISGCTNVWIPFPVSGTPSAGPGVKASKLSTVSIGNGISQVTYAGHPLYIYASAPTATSYIGASQFGGHWYAVNAKGKAVK